MGLKWIQQVIDADLKVTTGERLCLMALAYFKNDYTHRCHPKIETLRKAVGVKSRQLYKILHSLKEKGYVNIVKGQKGTNLYQLILPNPKVVQPVLKDMQLGVLSGIQGVVEDDFTCPEMQVEQKEQKEQNEEQKASTPVSMESASPPLKEGIYEGSELEQEDKKILEGYEQTVSLKLQLEQNKKLKEKIEKIAKKVPLQYSKLMQENLEALMYKQLSDAGQGLVSPKEKWITVSMKDGSMTQIAENKNPYYFDPGLKEGEDYAPISLVHHNISKEGGGFFINGEPVPPLFVDEDHGLVDLQGFLKWVEGGKKLSALQPVALSDAAHHHMLTDYTELKELEPLKNSILNGPPDFPKVPNFTGQLSGLNIFETAMTAKQAEEVFGKSIPKEIEQAAQHAKEAQATMASLEQNIAKAKEKQLKSVPGTLLGKLIKTWRESILSAHPDMSPLAPLTNKENAFLKAFARRVGPKSLEVLSDLVHDWGGFRMYLREHHGIQIYGTVPKLGIVAKYADEVKVWYAAQTKTEEQPKTAGGITEAKAYKGKQT